MSHWITYKNDILKNTRKNMLEKALKEMGLELDCSIKSIRNTFGHETVDMGIRKNGELVSLGFKEVKNGNDVSLELHGDFFNTGINQQNFMDTLSQYYTKNDIVDKIENNTSYDIESIETNENGEFEIMAYQYV